MLGIQEETVFNKAPISSAVIIIIICRTVRRRTGRRKTRSPIRSGDASAEGMDGREETCSQRPPADYQSEVSERSRKTLKKNEAQKKENRK